MSLARAAAQGCAQEMTDEDVVLVLQKFPVLEWCGGMGHGEGSWLAVPTLLHEGDLEPVDDGLTIKFCSGVNDGPSESAPRFFAHAIALKEYSHVRFRKVYFLWMRTALMPEFSTEKAPKKIHI